MVITSPFSSIKGYIVTKPPLVLFTLCLMVFAITTFSFAYYMEHSETIPNSDAHRDWDSFLRHLNKIEYCMEPNGSAATHHSATVNYVNNNSNNNEVGLKTVAVLSDITISQVINVIYLQGHVSVDDWNRECPQTTPVEKVHISFSLVNNSQNPLNTTDVCVFVTGPKDLLEIAAAQKGCVATSPKHNISWVPLRKKHVPSACQKRNQIFMKFKSDSDDELLLSLKDRTIINLHLLHTSYFLLVMAITLVCYAMIKGKPPYSHQLLDNNSVNTI